MVHAGARKQGRRRGELADAPRRPPPEAALQAGRGGGRHRHLRRPLPGAQLRDPRARDDALRLRREEGLRHQVRLQRRRQARVVARVDPRQREGHPPPGRHGLGQRPRESDVGGGGGGTAQPGHPPLLRHWRRRHAPRRLRHLRGDEEDLLGVLRGRGAEDHRQRHRHPGPDLRLRHGLHGGGEVHPRGVHGGDVQRELHRAGEADGPALRLHRHERMPRRALRGHLHAAGDEHLHGEGPEPLRAPHADQGPRGDRRGRGLRRHPPLDLRGRGRGRQREARGRGPLAAGQDPRPLQGAPDPPHHQVHRPDVHDPSGEAQRERQHLLRHARGLRGACGHGRLHRRDHGEGQRALRHVADPGDHAAPAQARGPHRPLVCAPRHHDPAARAAPRRRAQAQHGLRPPGTGRLGGLLGDRGGPLQCGWVGGGGAQAQSGALEH
mmetsp:Transcript_17438/g.54853  ORF Transcript_17438/g.54853 Transcript_17438/m.54853 type:complete len:438 (-) Transcript_17438:157-1470(-)